MVAESGGRPAGIEGPADGGDAGAMAAPGQSGTMRPRTKESGRHVGAVPKALDLLESFPAQPTLSLKELIDSTGLNRSPSWASPAPGRRAAT